MDIDSLISEIFVRPALWDQKSKNHHNRFVLDKSWDVVAVKLNTTLNAVGRTEINNLIKDECIITQYDQVSSITANCLNIVINKLTVPAGKTLELSLLAGTTLTFEGTTKFGHAEWKGPLIRVKGEAITVQGTTGSVLDGQGQLYWDGKGGQGTTKPKFFSINANGGSRFSNINILNCPMNCISINSCDDVTVSGWNIDCSLGDTKGGHNTDGFDVSSSSNIIVENSIIRNQDDCVAVNKGYNMVFSNLKCYGGHGLSLSVGLSKTNADDNQVANITFRDNIVSQSANGLHIKTHSDGAAGLIQNVTYQNVSLSDISNFGVSIQQDYGGTKGQPKGNVPIKDLKLIDVAGTMIGKKGMPVYILCGTNGCDDWTWSNISISGGYEKNSCNFLPFGFNCSTN